MKSRTGSILVALAVGTACTDSAVPTMPAPGGRPGLTISDGQHADGDPRFFFLPPLVREPRTTGAFDAAASPVVEVCVLAGQDCAGPPIATSALPGSGMAAVEVDLTGQHYKARWNTAYTSTEPGEAYRVSVVARGYRLGFVDVQVVASQQEVRNVDTGEYVALVDGRNLDIRFRIEHGAPIPVAYYPLDGHAQDAVGAHHGAVVGAVATADRFGTEGGALIFDGVDDFVTVPSADALNFGTGDFTVAYWVFFNAIHFERGGMVHKDSYDNTPYVTATGWLLNYNIGNGGLGIEVRDLVADVGPIIHTRVAQEEFATGTWYHFAAVREGRIVRLYINGIQRAASVEPVPINVSNDAPLEFGNVSRRQQFLPGRLDDVFLYSRALSTSDIRRLCRC